MRTASQRLLDLISEANAKCTDYRISKLMNVSSAAVSRWRLGHSHMSEGNIISACNLAGERDVTRWQVFIGAERELGPDGDYYRAMRADFERLDRGEKLGPQSWLRTLIEGLPSRVAVIALSTVGALAMVAAGTFYASPENAAFASVFAMGGDIHYAKLYYGSWR